MKTLADFKRNLQAAMQTGQLLNVRREDVGMTSVDRGNAPVCEIKSTCFALQRHAKSYVEFRKASDWNFTDTTAIQSIGQSKLVFSFLKPAPAPPVMSYERFLELNQGRKIDPETDYPNACKLINQLQANLKSATPAVGDIVEVASYFGSPFPNAEIGSVVEGKAALCLDPLQSHVYLTQNASYRTVQTRGPIVSFSTKDLVNTGKTKEHTFLEHTFFAFGSNGAGADLSMVLKVQVRIWSYPQPVS